MNAKYVKQRIAMPLGLFLVVVHIAMTFYLWFEFSSQGNVYVEKIATPISAAFAISIVKYFIDTQGIIKKEEEVEVGIMYVALIGVVVVTLVFVYIGGVVLYKHTQMGADQLNQLYLFSETAMGGMFALIFTDLYERPREQIQ